MSNRRVPIIQPLPPAALLSRAGRYDMPFPFTGPRTRSYYMARNALWHSVDVLGLKPGDEVLMPAYNHGVEVAVLHQRGMNLRFYRVDRTMSVDLEDIERNITPNTKVLYAIHYLGFPQPVQELREIADRHGLIFYEDCALSAFSRAPEGPLGSFGDCSIFCLYKTLPVPHGGMLVLNRDDLELPEPADRPDSASTITYVAHRLLDHWELRGGLITSLGARGFRQVARAMKRTAGVEVTAVDSNDLDPSKVSMGMANVARRILKRLDYEDIVRRRRENYMRLVERLDGRVRLVRPDLPEGVCPLSLPLFVENKRAVWEKLWAIGVETVEFWSIHHAAVPMQDFPDAQHLRAHVMEAPCHQGLGEREIDRVVEVLAEHARWPEHATL